MPKTQSADQYDEMTVEALVARNVELSEQREAILQEQLQLVAALDVKLAEAEAERLANQPEEIRALRQG